MLKAQTLLNKISGRFQIFFRNFFRGPVFKLWNRPGTPAKPGTRLRIAVCYLIPLLGDVVMLFPLLDALRRDQPQAEISVFVAGIGRILSLHPAVDHLYLQPSSSSRVFHDFFSAQVLAVRRWWRKDLRHLRFDVCVLPRGGADPFSSAHLAWLLGAKRRVGFSPHVEPERLWSDMGSAALLTDQIESVGALHEVQRGADVLRRAGLLKGALVTDRPVASLLRVARLPEAQAFVATRPELAKPYFVISPGASNPRKEWPEESFSELAREVARAHNWIVVIVGGSDVRATGERIGQQLGTPYVNLAGETGFEQLCAVCLAAQAFVGNDSGPGHVAGSLGTPAVLVSFYARSGQALHQSSPNRTHPAGPWFTIVQPALAMEPCVDECSLNQTHCIRQVGVPEVLEALDRLLQRKAAGEVSQTGDPS